MDILWVDGAWLTPGIVRERLAPDRKVAYTTVMTVLVRLWKKDRVQRRRRGRAFEYRAAQSRAAYAAERMEEMLGSADDRALALTHFVDTLTPQERSELRRRLEGS